MRPLLLLFLVLLGFSSRVAPVPADTLYPVGTDRLLSYTYANDLFFRTDYYFTQGMTLTLVHPALARLPMRHRLLSGPRGSTQYYGLWLRAGQLNPYFSPLGLAGQSSWQLYGQATLEGRLIGYDATLQGGLFTSNDPYTLATGTIRRTVLRSSGGLVLAHEKLSFEATATWISPEFMGGRTHRWGCWAYPT